MNFEVLSEFKQAKLWALERLNSPQTNVSKVRKQNLPENKKMRTYKLEKNIQ